MQFPKSPLPVVALLACAVGCSASNKASRSTADVSTTKTTSAAMLVRADAPPPRSSREPAASDSDAVAHAKTRAELERRTRERLVVIDDQMRALRDEAPRAGAARRAKLENALADIAKQREDVDRDLRRARTIAASKQRELAREVELTLDEMERELRVLRR